MKCENKKCNTEHNGDYGSGRFCSRPCSNSRARPDHVIKAISKKLSGRKYPDRGSTWNEGSAAKLAATWEKKYNDTPFAELKSDNRRRRLLAEQSNKCSKCGIGDWLGKPITLEVDHINGDNTNNSRSNLEALCPNCHSQTSTWRGRNKPSRNGSNKVTDSELIKSLASHPNIRQALLAVGLAAKGGNYARAKKLSRSERVRFPQDPPQRNASITGITSDS